MSRPSWWLLTIPVAALTIFLLTQSVGEEDRSPGGLVDHHVHLLSPDLIRDWRKLGVTFSRPDSAYETADALLARPDEAVASVVLVPMGHLYAVPDFARGLGLDAEAGRRALRRENEYVASVAARSSTRAVALCSVPALADWALAELARCHDSLGVAGIKLHLASSGVDLRDSVHLARVAAIAAFAARKEIAVLVHLDPQLRGHDSTHIRAFAERVLGPFPSLTVVIAHLGGSGGYGPWTRTVFRALRRWKRDEEASGTSRRLFFDLSAVVLETESEGVPATTAAEAEMLRDDLRSAPLGEIVFGSDYPVFDPVQGRDALLHLVGLSPDEVAMIGRRAEGGIFRPRPRPR
jgi:predicted TIM-barrel fold metal-dependent hydrolase